MSRIALASALVLAPLLGTLLSSQAALAAHHEPVLMGVTVEVAPGRMDEYRKAVKQLQGVMDRLGGGATVRIWNVTAGGPASGSTLVAVEYQNAAAWASLSQKTQQDAEWQKIVAGLPALRTVEDISLYKDISPIASESPSGPVLAVTGVRVEPGKLDEYLSRIADSRSISERLGVGGRLRVWQATLAGTGTGAVFVGVEYASLSAYVNDQAKLEGDAEWQKLIAGLDAIRTLEGRWLYGEATP